MQWPWIVKWLASGKETEAHLDELPWYLSVSFSAPSDHDLLYWDCHSNSPIMCGYYVKYFANFKAGDVLFQEHISTKFVWISTILFPSWFGDVNICGQHNLKCLIAYTIGPYTFKTSETYLTKIPEIMIDNKIFNLKYINVSLKSYWNLFELTTIKNEPKEWIDSFSSALFNSQKKNFRDVWSNYSNKIFFPKNRARKEQELYICWGCQLPGPKQMVLAWQARRSKRWKARKYSTNVLEFSGGQE